MVVNFREETKQFLDRYNIKEVQITRVTRKLSGDWCTWEIFGKLANFEYNPFANRLIIADDLCIMLNNRYQAVRRWTNEDGSHWNLRHPYNFKRRLQFCEDLCDEGALPFINIKKFIIKI